MNRSSDSVLLPLAIGRLSFFAAAIFALRFPISLSNFFSQHFFIQPKQTRYKSLLSFLIPLLCSSPMAQRSHVPAFGNWESEGNVPYTVFFDKARKGRGGGPIRNPNDPEEYPDILMDNSHEAPPSKPSPKDDTPPPKPTTHERRQSREDGGFRPYANSPGNRENQGRRQSGSEYSIDRSPLHRQAKPSARDSSMTEGKSFEGNYDNRGKTKTKNNSPPEGTALPKFGSWDVNNPASADGFTHIFGKVREERLGPGTPQHSSSPYNNANNGRPDDSAKGGGCFPCLRRK